ncbi:hypothetical protein PRIPAC_93043 [Pristionchus pacificus]|nr:hypothetical protein PRIPAC_93043 [Pristionchus pacificus]
MSNPPAKKKKREYSKISMVVEKWEKGQFEQFSAVHRISGYPWRLRLYGDWIERDIELQCCKSDEAELWTCYAKIKSPLSYFSHTKRRSFKSWSTKTHHKRMTVKPEANDELMTTGSLLEVEIAVSSVHGDKWRSRPILDSVEFRDGILVIGKEKKKINVNKAYSLYSSIDSSLENSRRRIWMKSLLKMLNMRNFASSSNLSIDLMEFPSRTKICTKFYNSRTDSTSRLSRTSVLATSSLVLLLSPFIRDSLSRKRIISICSRSIQMYTQLLKELLILRYTPHRLNELMNSPELESLSKETTKLLLKQSCKFVNSYDNSDNESNFSETESAELSGCYSSEEN